MTKPMIAYHGDKNLKESFIHEIKKHEEADARALMLIHLLEQKLLTLPV